MELSDIQYFMSDNNFVTDINPIWVVKGKFLMFKKYEHIPVCYIEDDIVYVFLDAKITKHIIKLTNHLVKNKIEFYFTSPEMSNPKGINKLDYHDEIIKHYLTLYSNKDFYYGFKKIEFDLIDNMVKWTMKENCFNSIKDNLEIIKKRILKKEYDYYTNKLYYNYDEMIREDFNSLYRHIVLSRFV